MSDSEKQVAIMQLVVDQQLEIVELRKKLASVPARIDRVYELGFSEG